MTNRVTLRNGDFARRWENALPFTRGSAPHLGRWIAFRKSRPGEEHRTVIVDLYWQFAGDVYFVQLHSYGDGNPHEAGTGVFARAQWPRHRTTTMANYVVVLPQCEIRSALFHACLRELGRWVRRRPRLGAALARLGDAPRPVARAPRGRRAPRSR